MTQLNRKWSRVSLGDVLRKVKAKAKVKAKDKVSFDQVGRKAKDEEKARKAISCARVKLVLKSESVL